MKGTILTLCIICFGCAIFCAGLFIHSDALQLDRINQAVKRSINTSMNVLIQKEIDQRTKEKAMEEFIDSFEVLAPKNIHYAIEMLGFNNHPLLIRIRVNTSEGLKKVYSFEETMIEEVMENEE